MLITLIATLIASSAISATGTITFTQPAQMWEETLPLGNGRLGAMPDGGIYTESIVLNEETMWSGSPQATANPDALRWLPAIRAALLKGDNLTAERLTREHFTCLDGGSVSPKYGSFQTLGKLIINIDDPVQNPPAPEKYRRTLDIRKALASTEFETADGVRHRREYFASIPDDVIVIRLRTSKKTRMQASLTRPENAEFTASGDTLIMRGTLPSGTEKPGIRYVCKALVKDANRHQVKGTKQATILVASATSYNNADPEFKVDSTLKTASQHSYRALRRRAQKAHRKLYDRVKIDLPDTTAAFYAQYGRYLLISSTARATLPPNLQGIWADGCSTPWNGDYHLNINVQMNHWGAGPGNLSEADIPMTDYVESLVESGTNTARSFYGTNGWTAHVLANVWGFTAPSEDPSWGATFTGGAWAALQLWEHYQFTLDKEYLERVYPTLYNAALFLKENLFEDPATGLLATGPSTSPENSFIYQGKECHVCLSPAMDIQIIKEIFKAVCQAADILEKDNAEEFQQAMSRLPADKTGSDGRLLEWQQEYPEVDPQHRHVSHLFGLYPGTTITNKDAARKSLEVRGDQGTGWSRAWKICFWARLGDGNRAYKLLQSLLNPVNSYKKEPDQWGNTVGFTGSGTLPNYFCAHPPFQIDGNFGGSAGIMEMLLQSHEVSADGTRIVSILPAIPDSWNRGEFKGLKARGNITVSCKWADGKADITLRSPKDQEIILCTPFSAGQRILLRKNDYFRTSTIIINNK